jgi:ABC-type Fe3+-hydroxamate transport system substrate-binding protein
VPLRQTDDTGRLIELPAPPQRIVSLIPSVTELICSLGGASRLVGVTTYCTEPREVVAKLAKVGGTKNPDCVQILALRPDVVLANSEENRREDYDRLVGEGVPVYVTFPADVREAALSIRNLGAILALQPEAVRLAELIEEKLRGFDESERLCPFFCPIWRNPWMSFNRETFAHDLLLRAGGANVCADEPTRYPIVDLAAIAARAPEVVLLPDEPYRFSEKHRESLRPLAETPAGRMGRIHFVDGKALSWYGPRTPAALDYFAALLRRP